MRSKRLTVRETIEKNQSDLSGLARLMGKVYNPAFELPPKRKAPVKKSSSGAASEAQIQKSILQYLKMEPRVAWVMRVNSGVFSESDRFISANSQKGMADIIGMMQGGRLFAIEVKSASGRVMPHQQEYLDIIANGGGLSGVARSIEDAKSIIFNS